MLKLFICQKSIVHKLLMEPQKMLITQPFYLSTLIFHKILKEKLFLFFFQIIMLLKLLIDQHEDFHLLHNREYQHLYLLPQYPSHLKSTILLIDQLWVILVNLKNYFIIIYLVQLKKFFVFIMHADLYVIIIDVYLYVCNPIPLTILFRNITKTQLLSILF